jgi:hypothetical protein
MLAENLRQPLPWQLLRLSSRGKRMALLDSPLSMAKGLLVGLENVGVTATDGF